MPKEPPKYLTDMKELPQEGNDTPSVDPMPKVVEPKKEPVNVMTEKPKEEVKVAKDMPIKKDEVKNEEPKPKNEKKVEPVKEVVEEALAVEPEKKKFPLTPREIILVVINIFSILFLIVLLIKLPEKAQEHKKLRIEDTRDLSALSYEFDEIKSREEDYTKLKDLFVDESGIVRFVNEVEKFKGPDSSVQSVTFTHQTAVKDRSGNYGIPIVIEMRGTWEQIGKDMERIQVVPFLFRPATFEARPTFERPGSTDVRYGVFLYVKEDLAKK